MKTGTFRVKRWLSLGLLMLMILSFAVPAFALPYRWYKNVYVHKNPNKMTYNVGDYMDLDGLELWGDVYDSDGNFVFTNDDMRHLDSQYFKYSPTKFTKAGKQKVTFSCNCVAKSGNREWLSTSITVTVKRPAILPPRTTRTSSWRPSPRRPCIRSANPSAPLACPSPVTNIGKRTARSIR